METISSLEVPTLNIVSVRVEFEVGKRVVTHNNTNAVEEGLLN